MKLTHLQTCSNRVHPGGINTKSLSTEFSPNFRRNPTRMLLQNPKCQHEWGGMGHDYLCHGYKDKKGQILDSSTYVTETMKDILQQMNGSDCGMFTLKYAEYISQNAEITCDQEHMQYFRRRTVYELLNNQFL